MPPARPPVVAIPVRNEAQRIDPCLRALAAQHGACLSHVVLLLNNCTDDTCGVVRALAPSLPFGVVVVPRTYPPPIAHAGTARRAAMQVAAALAGPDGIVLTTDADGRVAPDWLVHTLAALDAGAEVVCGRALIDPEEARLIPAHLHEDDRMETAYATLLDRIHDLVDPDLHDPWPRHTEHSGASIAVTVAAWRRAGGVPAVPLGEDRGFVRALRHVDAAIRHAPDVTVWVSGRTAGRACGGMADTMARRMVRQDEMLDDSLEPPRASLRRAQARATLRRLRALLPATGPWHDAVADLAALLRLPAGCVAHMSRARFGGMAWDRLAALSPVLRRVPIRRADLPMHMDAARRIVNSLLVARAMPHVLPAAAAESTVR
ncbi:glycosyltransferase family 2 protein [Komagataeibacter sp. FXV3]|uniref:glycosyltransferase n=1 Tax=Komagataeibacter sp. FXV3 TaxID=2608998 RepID=UPI00187B48D5|nr:glycosyltransferase family A protein [Komagataeibacter sp. FXV3]MBE7728891.1 glycosyltransferase family 2 protein [Komagataeibacter sp. FXV3]